MAESTDSSRSTRYRRKRPSKTEPSLSPLNDARQDGRHACTCQKDISVINSKLDKILESLESMNSRLTKLEVNLQETIAKVTGHSKEIEELKSAVSFTENQYKKATAHINNLTDGNHRHICRLEDQIDDLQNRSRRNNVVVHGIPEGSEGDESCETFLADFFSTHMKLEDGHDIEIERAIEPRDADRHRHTKATTPRKQGHVPSIVGYYASPIVNTS